MEEQRARLRSKETADIQREQQTSRENSRKAERTSNRERKFQTDRDNIREAERTADLQSKQQRKEMRCETADKQREQQRGKDTEKRKDTWKSRGNSREADRFTVLTCWCMYSSCVQSPFDNIVLWQALLDAMRVFTGAVNPTVYFCANV